MSVEVKICGIKTQPALQAALAAGADYIGLVFYARSPRCVTLETARMLAREARGRARSVALCVDPDDDLLNSVIGEAGPDIIQLHGRESPERVRAIRDGWGRKIIKAVKIGSPGDALAALDYENAADLILFDAKPAAAALPGGNGLSFDWRLLEPVRDKVAFMLSGGLNPDNVRAAVTLTGARAVDVSSGVERIRGEKDPELIRRFIQAAKSTRAIVQQ